MTFFLIFLENIIKQIKDTKNLRFDQLDRLEIISKKYSLKRSNFVARSFFLQKSQQISILQSSILWDNDKFGFEITDEITERQTVIKDNSSHSNYFHSIYGNCGKSNQECIGADLEKRFIFVLGPKYMVLNKIDKNRVEI